MKKTILAFSFILCGALCINAQTAPAKSSSTTQTTPATTQKHKKHNQTAVGMYECPMKCEPASKTAGKCAKCGMDKVKVGAK